MAKSQLVLFDFDGTIADSLPVIVTIFRDLAKNHKHIHPILDVASLDQPLLDQPTVNILRRQGLIPAIKSLRLNRLRLMFVYLRAQHRFAKYLNQLQPCQGMAEVLLQLQQQYTLGIVTSNRTSNVQAFLDRHQLNYFTIIKSQRNLFAKANTLRAIIRQHNYQLSDVVYIGDEVRDLEAAQRAGIASIGVSWGLSHRDLLTWNDATAVIDQPQQLLTVIPQVLRG